jgi:hypothetical protein
MASCDKGKQKPDPGERPSCQMEDPPEEAPVRSFWRGLSPRRLRVVDWVLFTVICVTAVLLQIILYCHAGAFWRDEASTLLIANAPDLSTLWAWLGKDSAPAPIYLLVRLWTWAGIGTTDDGMRLFGTVMFLGLIASVFFSCRAVTGSVPLVAIALVPLNVTIFYYGSSIRAYGLAMVLIVACFGAFWRLARSPTWCNATASLLLAILSCQATYLNCCLLLGIGVGAATVSALCRRWRRVFGILAICIVAAISVLPYLPAIRAHEQAMLDGGQSMSFSVTRFDEIFQDLAKTLSDGSSVLLVLWIVLLACAMVLAIARVIGRRGSLCAAPSLPLYVLIAAVVGGSGELLLLAVQSNWTNVWHLAPLTALAGVVIDVGIGRRDNRKWKWLASTGATCVVIAVSLPMLWTSAHLRRTNLDRVSAEVAKRAVPGDLILVNTFWLAPGFKYHYRGDARWNTLPLTSSDMEASIYPLPGISRLTAVPNAIEPTLREVRRTLKSGNRLWIVGSITLLPRNAVPPSIGPTPDPEYGSDFRVYIQIWALQVAHLIQTHALRLEVVPVSVDRAPVNECEDVMLLRVEGWRGRTKALSPI